MARQALPVTDHLASALAKLADPAVSVTSGHGFYAVINSAEAAALLADRARLGGVKAIWRTLDELSTWERVR